MIKQPKHDFFVLHWDRNQKNFRVVLSLLLMSMSLAVYNPDLNAGSRTDLNNYESFFDQVYRSEQSWLEMAPDTIPPQAALGLRSAGHIDSLLPAEREFIVASGNSYRDGDHVGLGMWRAASSNPAEIEELYFISYIDDDSAQAFPIACWPSSTADFGIKSCCDSLRYTFLTPFAQLTSLIVVSRISRSFRPARGQFGTSLAIEVETLQVWDPFTGVLLLDMPVVQQVTREGQQISGNLGAGGAGLDNIRRTRNIARTELNFELKQFELIIDSCSNFTSTGDGEMLRSAQTTEFIGPKPGRYRLTQHGYARVTE